MKETQNSLVQDEAGRLACRLKAREKRAHRCRLIAAVANSKALVANLRANYSTFFIALALTFSACVFGPTVGLAQTQSPEAQALVREGVQLDQETGQFNAQCANRKMPLESAEYKQCGQWKTRLEARQKQLMTRALALKQAESAREHGEAARKARDEREAHKQASAVFDQGTSLPADSSMVVDTRGLVPTPPVSAVPEQFKNNAEIMKHDADARRWDARVAELERKLAKQEQELRTPGEHRELPVERAKTINDIVASKSQRQVAELEKLQQIHFEEKKLGQ